MRNSGNSMLKSTMRESGTQVDSQVFINKPLIASPSVNEDLADLGDFNR